jgi:hypothetical protein
MNKLIEPKIEIKNVENVKPEYSNYVQISHSPHEFTITFCYIDSAKTVKGEVPKFFAEAFARVVISPSLLPNIIEAFEINLKKYNESIKKEFERKQ